MLINKNAIIFGETNLVISCMEHLIDNGWSINYVVTRDNNVVNWCSNNSIQHLTIDEISKITINNCYLFSIINPYIIPNKLLLQINPIKAINYHDSLLPKYAGLNSTTWSIFNNEKVHGVSWHEITSEIDEGNIYYQEKIVIDEVETAFSLNLKCAEAALVGFIEVINNIEQNELIELKQDASRKSYFGREYILRNYGYINPDDKIDIVNKFLNSVSFGNGYFNTVGTVKVKIHGKHYILEKQSYQKNIQTIDLLSCVFKNMYGDEKLLNEFDLESCVPSINDINILKKLKQQEFATYNNLANMVDIYKIQNRFSASKTIKKIEINAEMSTDILCLFLSIISIRLNPDIKFIKIYHENIEPNLSKLVNDITEQISILTIKSKNLNLSYRDMLQEVINEIYHNKFHLVKDFGYRYKINLCSEIAVVDNYLGEIDNHRIVFYVKHNKITVNFYEEDITYANILVNTIYVLFVTHNEAKNSDIQVKNLQLLSKEDYQMVVYDWNKTEKYYPDNKTLHKLFEEQVVKTPEQIAVIYESVELTYKELNEKSNQLANYIQTKYQIQGDDLIFICLDKSEYLLITILAILKVRCCVCTN